MRRLALPLVLLAAGLAALAPPAAAQAPTVDLVMEDHLFRLATGGDRNPVIPVAAGEEVMVRVTNRGDAEHGFHVGAPVGQGTTCCQAPGESATLAFTVPEGAPAEIRYWCPLHRAQGMEGVLRVQASGGVPRLTLLGPEEGATVPPQFTVSVRVENATLGQDARLHYLVNGQTGHPGWNSTSPTFTTPVLPQGYHLVRVELVDAQGRPRDPPVAAERVVFVSSTAPPEATTPGGDAPPSQGGEDDPAGTPGPGVALALLAVGAAALARRARRA